MVFKKPGFNIVLPRFDTYSIWMCNILAFKYYLETLLSNVGDNLVTCAHFLVLLFDIRKGDSMTSWILSVQFFYAM